MAIPLGWLPDADHAGSTARFARRHADWESNVRASPSPRRKLRHLATLLAKEMVMHSCPAPQLDPILEQLVEVLNIPARRLERG